MKTPKAQSAKQVSYTHRRRLTQPMADVVQRVREALAVEGFGVLTEIDVQATLKKKLNVDRSPYLILGACNPALAHRALTLEPSIGVFLPCNVDVYVDDDGATVVETVRPRVLFEHVQNKEVGPVADEVNARLLRVLDALE
jgi:uncharacterized protein (DUF302 family)